MSSSGEKVKPAVSASKDAMAAIFGTKNESKDDPRTQSGVEPPSGITGKGTVNEPYDQGNAPENISTGQEPVSGAQGKGTVNEPYDKGNAGEAAVSSVPVNVTSTDDDGSHSPTSKPVQNGSKTPQPAQKTDNNNDRGRQLQPPANQSRFDRSVSPGTLDDGSHQLCSGEKGESYEPSRGLGRLKDKFRSKAH